MNLEDKSQFQVECRLVSHMLGYKGVTVSHSPIYLLDAHHQVAICLPDLGDVHLISPKFSENWTLFGFGVYDALSDILWGKCFIEVQGHVIDHNVLLQDNSK